MKEIQGWRFDKQLARWKKFLLYGILVSVAVLLSTYGAISWVIDSGVESLCEKATTQYPGDNVEALMAYVNSEHNSIRERNRAVWALGQLGDRRALPALQEYYTGQPCQHDKYLCQHELRKAIRLCEGGTNITAWIWR